MADRKPAGQSFWLERDWQRQGKAQVRSEICDLGGKQLRSVLLLPGLKFGCVRELRRNGSITHNTRISAVEHNMAVADRMVPKIGTMGLRTKLFRMRLEDLHPARYLFVDRKVFDLAYLDWCGPMTESRYDWLCSLSGTMAKGSILSVTYLRSLRNARFEDNKKVGSAAISMAFSLLDDCQGGRITKRLVITSFSRTTARLVAQTRSAIGRKFRIICCYEYNDTQLAGIAGGSYMTTFKVKLDEGL